METEGGGPIGDNFISSSLSRLGARKVCSELLLLASFPTLLRPLLTDGVGKDEEELEGAVAGRLRADVDEEEGGAGTFPLFLSKVTVSR